MRSSQVDPITFMKTVYLGDRACKRIILDSWKDQIKIQVDCISRVRDPSGHWNFYTTEDIEDGSIVLSQVAFFAIDPPGLIPNDYIYDVEVELLHEGGLSAKPLYLFAFSIGHVDQTGNHQTVTVKIKARDVHLEDPTQPGVLITD
jgi:hypothetical protein